MKITLHKFDLKLLHPFRTYRQTKTVQRTLIVELQDKGISGFGEATENPFYGVTIEGMTELLEGCSRSIESKAFDQHTDKWPVRFWEQMRPELCHWPFAQCALDLAAYDLWGKRLGQPVWRLWGLSLENLPPSDYTIGIDSIESMIGRLKEFSDWPIYKIKLGTENDLEIVRQLRKQTDAVFRVDANCSWTVDQTIAYSHELKSLGVEFIEQPLAPGDWNGMEDVYRETALPIIADESCQLTEDVDRCVDHFDGINIKLVKCGGITPAGRMICRARELGLKVMMGCMTESSVGISAIAQLLPMLDYVDIDGPLLLANDIATGVQIDRGRVIYPEENGCGARLITKVEPR